VSTPSVSYKRFDPSVKLAAARSAYGVPAFSRNLQGRATTSARAPRYHRRSRGDEALTRVALHRVPLNRAACRFIHFPERIFSACRARWNLSRRQKCRHTGLINSRAARLFIFKRPLLLCSVDLPQVMYALISQRRGMRSLAKPMKEQSANAENGQRISNSAIAFSALPQCGQTSRAQDRTNKPSPKPNRAPGMKNSNRHPRNQDCRTETPAKQRPRAETQQAITDSIRFIHPHNPFKHRKSKIVSTSPSLLSLFPSV
jgi:hypothetical protein